MRDRIDDWTDPQEIGATRNDQSDSQATDLPLYNVDCRSAGGLPTPRALGPFKG